MSHFIEESTLHLFDNVFDDKYKNDYVPCQFGCGLACMRREIKDHVAICVAAPSGNPPVAVKFQPFLFYDEQTKLMALYQLDYYPYDEAFGTLDGKCFGCVFGVHDPDLCICSLPDDGDEDFILAEDDIVDEEALLALNENWDDDDEIVNINEMWNFQRREGG